MVSFLAASHGVKSHSVVGRDLIDAGALQVLLFIIVAIEGSHGIKLADDAVLVGRIGLVNAVLVVAPAFVDLDSLDFTIDNGVVLVVVAILVMDQVGDRLAGQEQRAVAVILDLDIFSGKINMMVVILPDLQYQ